MAETIAQPVGKFASIMSVVRRIIGVPDYDTYVEHMKVAHPDCPPLSKDDFSTQRMQDRYSRPGARCC